MHRTSSPTPIKPPPERYSLELTAINGPDKRPGIIRLRQALKTLLRTFALRCDFIKSADGSAVEQ